MIWVGKRNHRGLETRRNKGDRIIVLVKKMVPSLFCPRLAPESTSRSTVLQALIERVMFSVLKALSLVLPFPLAKAPGQWFLLTWCVYTSESHGKLYKEC